MGGHHQQADDNEKTWEIRFNHDHHQDHNGG